MEAAGLLVRRSHERDARLVRPWLTERGRAVRADVERARDGLELRVTAPLTAGERVHLPGRCGELPRSPIAGRPAIGIRRARR
jgi:DNA-binding MarR family transcriptional regulator